MQGNLGENMASFLYTLVIYPLYLLIEVIYKIFYKLAGSQGLAVIGVSVGITLLCLPLYAVAERWQQAERDIQAKMKGGLDRIKTAFAGDERYMMTQTFYKQHRYQPIMALRSSFGLLIQIPFFMAAYQFLSGLEALKGVSFLFIRDMGVPDATFHIGSFAVNVLPVAMTLINMAAGVVYTKGLALREKIQVHGMALIFLAILYNSPSGLVLYWTMNNVFSLVKNIFYKLKNPLKVFWIFSCVLCAAAAVYAAFFFEAKTAYKAALLAFFALVFAAPLFVKAAKKLLDASLKTLVESKSKRASVFFLSCLFLTLLFGLVIPSALISSSASEFSGIGSHPNPFWRVGNTALQAAAIFLFWFSCVYFLFGKKIQALMAAGTFILALSALLNAYPFMLRYGDISASLGFLAAADFKSISPVSLLNLAALAAAAVLALFLARIKNALSYVMAILSMTGAIIFGFNAAEIQKEFRSYMAAEESQKKGASLSPIFRLSKNHPNAILIMLDRAQGQFFEENLKEAPELARQFSGFVFYNNALSFNGHTFFGAPPLFGGYEYAADKMQAMAKEGVSTRDLINQSQLAIPRIFNEQLGYWASVNDPVWINSNTFCDLSFLKGYDIEGNETVGAYTQEWYKAHPEAADLDSTEEILNRNLLFFSLFRCSPIILREAVYNNGSYFNTKENVKDAKTVIDNYSVLDFLPQLCKVEETSNGSYISLMNELTHSDFFFEPPDYRPAAKPQNFGTSRFKQSSSYHTQMAALKLLGKWMDFLKEQGVYDNTRIVITADHGGVGTEDCMEADPDLDRRVGAKTHSRSHGRGHYHPLFLFKDFNASGSLSQKPDFMTNADSASLLLNGLIEKPVNPFTQKEIPLDTRPLKENGVVITTSDRHRPTYHKDPHKFDIRDDEWWLVKDDIFKASSWTQIEHNIE